jgi:hypothetical protein
MTFIPHRLLPRSLSGRLFATFGLCGLVFLLFGLGIFYRYQFTQRLADTTGEANAIANITAQAVSRQLETGDRSQLRQIIQLAIAGTRLKSVAFSTGVGSTISVRRSASAGYTAPACLTCGGRSPCTAGWAACCASRSTNATSRPSCGVWLRRPRAWSWLSRSPATS